MTKRGTSPCRVPCHRDRMGPAAAAAAAGVAVVDVGDVGDGGVEVVAGVDAAAGLVAEEPGTSRIWGWGSGRKSCSDRVGPVRAGRTGRGRRRGTLQSAR